VEAFGVLIKFKMALPWKPRYQNNGVGWGDVRYCFEMAILVIIIIIILPLLVAICPTEFSETDDPIFTKLHRKVDPHLKRCIQVLEFSKWPPFPWKP
jgi:hypothetical protein